MILTYLERTAELFGYIAAIITASILLIKPLRNKILGLCDISNGLKSILRSKMLHTYYQRRENDTISQHEMENFHSMYKAYKTLGGNSFMDDIYKEVRTWEVND